MVENRLPEERPALPWKAHDWLHSIAIDIYFKLMFIPALIGHASLIATVLLSAILDRITHPSDTARDIQARRARRRYAVDLKPTPPGQSAPQRRTLMADTDNQTRRDNVSADTIDHHRAGAGDENAQTSEDDVRHLAGLELPDTLLPTTTNPKGQSLRQLAATAGRLVIYAYPAIGAPDRALITADWMTIPGAFGCTAESCSFRDLNSAIHELGAAVCGLSTQPTTEQREAAQRLSLTFPLLSDANHDVINHLQLPTWSAQGHRLLKRFTLIARGTLIQHVFAPVPDPATHASDVAAWLQQHPR